MVKFVADSSCDLLSMHDVDFISVPLTICTASEQWTDNETIDIHHMLDTLSSHKGRSYTSCPTLDQWLEAFGQADIIYVVAMTSGLSGTYNAACAARDLYLQNHPEAKVYVFDTCTTGPEQRLLVEKIAQWMQEGLSFDQICSMGMAYLEKTRLFYAQESLHNFAQNGRVSQLAAKAVGVLGIRIVATASPQGMIEPISKCRGAKSTLKEFMEQLHDADYQGGRLLLSHVENEPFAAMLKEAIEQDFPGAQVQVYHAGGLCSYYAEKGGILIGCECGETESLV